MVATHNRLQGVEGGGGLQAGRGLQGALVKGSWRGVPRLSLSASTGEEGRTLNAVQAAGRGWAGCSVGGWEEGMKNRLGE